MEIKENIMYIIFLLLIIFIIIMRRVEGLENFEDASIYYGVLPKENHPSRINNLIYYDDPIYIKYNDKYLVLNDDKAVKEKSDAEKQIIYLNKTKASNGLTPVSYMEDLYLRVFPKKDNNKIVNKEFRIVPYGSKDTNNPYLQINDFVCFKTVKEEYLCVNSVSLKLELVNSKSVPANAIFSIVNSPQCYINNVKYGIDTRNTSIKTKKEIAKKMKNVLENRMSMVSKSDSTIKMLKNKRKELLKEIENEKSKVPMENPIGKNELDNIRDKYVKMKLDIVKDFANKLLEVENGMDLFYVKEMNKILDEGCVKKVKK